MVNSWYACGGCGRPVDKNATYCTHCNVILRGMRCSKCGSRKIDARPELYPINAFVRRACSIHRAAQPTSRVPMPNYAATSRPPPSKTGLAPLLSLACGMLS